MKHPTISIEDFHHIINYIKYMNTKIQENAATSQEDFGTISEELIHELREFVDIE